MYISLYIYIYIYIPVIFVGTIHFVACQATEAGEACDETEAGKCGCGDSRKGHGSHYSRFRV